MKRHRMFGMLLAVSVGCLVMARTMSASAAETTSSVTMIPARYVHVDGDKTKFKAHNWMDTEYNGGVEFESTTLFDDETRAAVEGHAISDDNYALEAEWEKADAYFLNLGFDQFSKYYDSRGGIFHPFRAFRDGIRLQDELELKIGKFEVEAGVLLEDLPDVTLRFEHVFKDGMKSRTTWGELEDNGLTRNIVPSYQDIDETENMLELELSHQVLGFDVVAKQHWEKMEASTHRVERDISDTPDPVDKLIRNQYLDPETEIMSTSVQAERWMNEDKGFFGVAYVFTNLNNTEIEDLVETNALGVVTNFSRPEQTRDSLAHNEYDSHTAVVNGLCTPFTNVQLVTKLKSELISRDGEAQVRQFDGGGGTSPAAFDNVVDANEFKFSENKIDRFGEAISLRYTGLQRASFYVEAEAEQVRNWLDETKVTEGSAIDFFRETVSDKTSNSFAVGTRLVPVDFVDITGQYRYKMSDENFDHVRQSHPSRNNPDSAFIESLDTDTHEINTKIAFRPSRKFKPQIRYKYQHKDLETIFIGQRPAETNIKLHQIVGEVFVNPVDRLMLTGSIAKELSSTATPAKSGPTIPIPTFNADSLTYFFMADYVVNEKLSLNTDVQFTKADNFNDLTSFSVPYGADFELWRVSLGTRWKCTDRVSLEPEYAYYSYDTNPNAEQGGYEAHLVQLAVTVDWL